MQGEYKAVSVPGTVLRSAVRLAGRHRLVSSIVGMFVVAIIVVSAVTTSGAPASAARDAPVAPSFTLTPLTGSGQRISLSQYLGKPLIMNFWASWCPPCQQETPLLAQWYKQQHGRVSLVGLDENDSAADALKFAHAKGVTYPVGTDEALAAANAYGVTGLPQTFFLNAKHHIVYHVYGAITEADLAKGVRLMRQG
jgi:cytochrome c biogenesis protein CcmG, thiol:disulfide interchange protein DsbE